MLLLKIVNKSFFLHNLINHNYIKYLFHNIKILEFIKEDTFSYYVQ